MVDDEVTPLGIPTTNYGWTKPAVGGDIDAWGGMLNADLDGIDTTVKSVSNAIPLASSTTPTMNGTAAVGSATTWAKADHIHPTDASLASLAYVNALPVAMNDNRIINGDMRIDQRNNGATGTVAGYTIDRWQFAPSIVGKGTWGRGLGANPTGCQYWLSFISSSAYTPLAADYFAFQQNIEADAIADFLWGTSVASPVTLSFWAYSSLTGTFGGTLKNGAGTRSYPFSYSLPVASTWTKIAITIPGDTAGAWTLSGNGLGVSVGFDLGSGATYRGSAGAWASANYIGANGGVNTVAVNAAQFLVTGVKLEIGSVATPYNRQSLAKSMVDCQRYYQTLGLTSFGYGATSGLAGQMFAFNTIMRASPTVSLTSANVTNGSGLTAAPNSSGTAVYCTITAAGLVQFGGTATASAEL